MLEEPDIKAMIADYMEKGFLENIIDMFKHDKSLYPLIGDLMKDERMRVKLGITSLVETLTYEDHENILTSIPSVAGLLKDRNPVVRGDAAYLLGILGSSSALPYLKGTLGDENPEVREIVRESILEIEKRANNI